MLFAGDSDLQVIICRSGKSLSNDPGSLSALLNLKKVIFLLLPGLLFTPIASQKKQIFQLYKIRNADYARLEQILALDSQFILDFDETDKTVQIKRGKTVIGYKVGYRYWVSERNKYKLTAPPLYKKGVHLIPKELAEEILTEFNIPVKYIFRKNKINIEKDAQPEFTRKQGGLDFIVIDAGHGGKDPGAFGYFESREKQITLKVARSLAKALESKLKDTKIYLTRNKDIFLSLERRSRLANSRQKKGKFGIFISLHCNATLTPRTNGFEIYYLSQNPGNEKERALQIRENLSGQDRKYVKILESRLLTARIQHESKTLARSINTTFLTTLRGKVKGRGVRKADFAVLRGSLMPAVLVEIGYITNRNDLKQMKSEDFAKSFNEGIAKAIENFLKNDPLY